MIIHKKHQTHKGLYETDNPFLMAILRMFFKWCRNLKVLASLHP